MTGDPGVGTAPGGRPEPLRDAASYTPIVARALRSAYPGITFSLTSLSRGRVLHLSWTDGPSITQLSAAVEGQLPHPGALEVRTLRLLTRPVLTASYLAARAAGWSGWDADGPAPDWADPLQSTDAPAHPDLGAQEAEHLHGHATRLLLSLSGNRPGVERHPRTVARLVLSHGPVIDAVLAAGR